MQAGRGRSNLLGMIGMCQSARSAVRLNEVGQGMRHRVVSAVERADGRLQQRADRLNTAGVKVVERAERRMEHATAAIARTPVRVDGEIRHLDALAARVRLLDPVHAMARGWSITRTADGRVVRSAAELAVGDELVTTFAAGSARSVVEEVES